MTDLYHLFQDLEIAEMFEQHEEYQNLRAQIEKLGKFKTSGGCFNINKLQDINIAILKDLIAVSLWNKLIYLSIPETGSPELNC